MAPEAFKRKLTAILSADAAGYSRLMEKDEEATVRTLTSCVYKSCDKLSISTQSYAMDTFAFV
jgi:class 3 adenylate cyclase